MPLETERSTMRDFLAKILQPHLNIKDPNSRQQARITTFASLILAGICVVAGIIGLLITFSGILTIGLFLLAVTMLVAFVMGRSENFLIGSIILVSGIIIGGFVLGSAFPDSTLVIMILMSTIIPAFTLGLVLLPLLAIIIIAVVVLITIGGLPLMANIAASTELLLFISLIIIEGIFILIAWFKETSEALQQDEIGSLRGRLEERIEERTRYSRIMAEIAQDLVSSKSTEELLDEAVSSIVARMGFSFSGIYIPDEAKKSLQLQAAHGPDADRLLRTGKRVNMSNSSLLGWVAENKQHRVVTNFVEDPLQLETELLPGNQSELAMPILSQDRLLGILDVQSTRTTMFDNETIVVLQMLVNQITTTVQNIRVMEAGQGNVKEVIEVYRTGFGIVLSKSEDEIDRLLQELFRKVTYISMFMRPEGETLKLIAASRVELPDGHSLPESIAVSINDLSTSVGSNMFIGEGARLNSLPYNLVRLLQQIQIFSVALIPVINNNTLSAILLIGTREREPLDPINLQPYTSLAAQIDSTIERLEENQKIEQHIEDLNTINIQLHGVADLATKISSALSSEEVFDATKLAFQNTSNSGIILIAEADSLRIMASINPFQTGELARLPERLNVAPAEVLERLGDKAFITETWRLSAFQQTQIQPEFTQVSHREPGQPLILPAPLLNVIEQSQLHHVAFIPVLRDEKLVTLLIIGSKKENPILQESLQVCNMLADLVTSSLERIDAISKTNNHLAETESIVNIGQEISLIRDLDSIYPTLHSYVRMLLGDINFLVALYDQSTSAITIPYMYEKGHEGSEITSIDTFPLGEGLTSILIRTKQPLMLVEDTERQAAALGAKISGKPAKSWLGTPLIITGEAIGALIIQDAEKEHAFSEHDLHLLTNLSAQVAGPIYNARLLEFMHARAIQLQTAAEVARDISGSLDLGELLNKAITLIFERFNFYHAAIFLLDTNNEYAVVREATGEAGTQMKRAEHKLKVGSKSIMGYVTGSGEPLVVNDTSRDATYYANPLLPETRAEVGIPLKVGQRILGALDVQSTRAYSFGEEDVRILRILADQMAIALINSELFADTQEHLSQHRLLHHVTTAAASGTTLEESLNSATQGLQVTLGGDRVSILLADKGNKTLNVRAFAGYSEEIGKLQIPFGEGITGWVAVHQQSQRINDVTQDPRYIQVGSNIRSELAIPLSYRGDLLGVLNVESDQIGAYNENDEELLGTLAGSLAAIISNARLIEQVRRQADHERMLFEVTSKIRRSTDIQTIMSTTAGELSKVLGARRAQIKMGSVDLGTNSEQSPDEPVSSPGESA